MANEVDARINGPVFNFTNLMAALMIALGGLTDPTFAAILPPAVAPKVLFFGGIVLGILRSFYTGRKTFNPTDMTGIVPKP